MALNVTINYEGKKISYEVESLSEDVYIFRICDYESLKEPGSIPQKLVIRKKGKIWVSDAENFQGLVNSLIHEIKLFNNYNVTGS